MKDEKRLARKLVRKWQKRLRLLDWRFSVEIVDEEELAAFFSEDDKKNSPRTMARQAWAATDADGPMSFDTTAIENRDVKILIKKGAAEKEDDLESLVKHELLHAVFWALTPEDPVGSVHLEQIINMLEKELK